MYSIKPIIFWRQTILHFGQKIKVVSHVSQGLKAGDTQLTPEGILFPIIGGFKKPTETVHGFKFREVRNSLRAWFTNPVAFLTFLKDSLLKEHRVIRPQAPP